MGWGWQKGEVLTFCRERGFVKLQTAFVSKMSWLPIGGIFSCAAIVMYSPRTENTRKIAANFQNEYKSGMQNFPCVGPPGPARNTAPGEKS